MYCVFFSVDGLLFSGLPPSLNIRMVRDGKKSVNWMSFRIGRCGEMRFIRKKRPMGCDPECRNVIEDQQLVTSATRGLSAGSVKV